MYRLRTTFARGFSFALALLVLPALNCGQTATPSNAMSSIGGTVCDAERRPIAGATVTLEIDRSDKPISTTTDAQGKFKFPGLAPGKYTLHVGQRDFADAVEGPIALREHDTKAVALVLYPLKDSTTQIPFSEETHFTVAGVTDTTSLGGHGSDPVRRNSDALSRETAHLSGANSAAPDEAFIRERLSKADSADLRFQLAELEEKSGRSLDAVLDYQRAAQLAPTEPHYFAWGAELLMHRAFEPAIEVFGKGRGLYPESVRMILGLGAATYAKGSTQEANKLFLQACDVAPSDPTPYVFLGRVQVTEVELSAGWVARLKRFVNLEPRNAKAHYFYAVALTKNSSAPEQLTLAMSELKAAVELDPHFGDAYLELGILASQQGELPVAITYLQKAVESTEFPVDAHYRLAQLYRRLGESDKARRETELYKQASEKKKQQVEQERHALQQFVYTLREQAPPTSNPVPQK